MLTGSATALPEDAGPGLKRLADELGIRGLRSFGIKLEDFSAITRKAAAASSMRGNPIPLLPDELAAILDAAW